MSNYNGNYCRCCGKPANYPDTYPIHTRCIPKHWSKHAKGINASRCHEFNQRAQEERARESYESAQFAAFEDNITQQYGF